MKPLKISFACAILFTILLFPVVLLMVTGKITLFDLHGFGVDTEEQVYLGTANGKILVWKDHVAVLGWIVSFVSIWYFAIRQMKKHPSKGGTLWF